MAGEWNRRLRGGSPRRALAVLLVVPALGTDTRGGPRRAL